ncbi:hypothetical protein C8J56DRAFT_558820 [Mycena floridula]|nr:hypothetical protein C8J56DRAFT_558820 [Mycena floridula]
MVGHICREPKPRQQKMNAHLRLLRSALRRPFFRPPLVGLVGPKPRFFNSSRYNPSNSKSWNPEYVFWTIVGVNGAVFCAWRASIVQVEVQRDPRLFQFLKDNFTVSWHNVSSGRVWTLFTHAFSHMSVSHILLNGIGMYFMARPVALILGGRSFLGLYLGTAAVSSLGSMAWTRYQKGDRNDSFSLGASGSLSATYSVLACMAPRMKFMLYGIVPVPAWLAVSGLFIYDSYRSITDTSPGIDSAGHVGGLLCGIGFYIGRRFRIF